MRQLKSPKITSLISLIASSIALSAACTPVPRTPVNDDLPIEKVVIYRNGVAYFERGGDVSDETIEFRMRTQNMGDFLGSMAILDESGGALRSASFPIEIDEDEFEDGAKIAPSEEEPDEPEPRPKKPSDVRAVKLHLDGKNHHLKVGYIAESPVWKPSYRVVFNEKGKALLQVWGIVQNLSGSDWNHVKLSLVGGAPISFRTDLGTPVIPYRPEVTDSGDIVAYVPPSRNSAMNADEEQAYAEEAVAEEYHEEKGEAFGSGLGRLGGSHAKNKMAAKPAAEIAEYDDAPEEAEPAPAPKWGGNAQATATSLGDNTSSTRFELDSGVTVPNGSSTMVLLASTSVPGEHYFLYSPEPEDATSQSYPYHVARFANGTQAALERGAVSVFNEKDFLGQGLMSVLGKGRSATIPFAQERGIHVTRRDSYQSKFGKVTRISRGRIQLARDSITTVIYSVDSKLASEQKLVIRHQHSSESDLLDIPKDTEKVDNESASLIPLMVKAKMETKIKFRERYRSSDYAEWIDINTIVALKELLADPVESKTLSAESKKALSEVIAFLEEANKLEDEVKPLNTQSRELSQAKSELESSLIAIEKNGRAADLRLELTNKLAKYSRELETVQRQLVDKRTRITELSFRVKQAVSEVNYETNEPVSEIEPLEME